MSESRQRPAVRQGHDPSAEEDAARAAKVRRSAWRFGLLAVGLYLGFIAWNALRAPLGG